MVLDSITFWLLDMLVVCSCINYILLRKDFRPSVSGFIGQVLTPLPSFVDAKITKIVSFSNFLVWKSSTAVNSLSWSWFLHTGFELNLAHVFWKFHVIWTKSAEIREQKVTHNDPKFTVDSWPENPGLNEYRISSLVFQNVLNLLFKMHSSRTWMPAVEIGRSAVAPLNDYKF